jgi:hypothetical protein
MADVPQRIWACPGYNGDIDGKTWDDGICGTYPDGSDGERPYILATPEALTSQPEVQALIRAAELRGKRAAMDAIHAAVLALSQEIEAGE